MIFPILSIPFPNNEKPMDGRTLKILMISGSFPPMKCGVGDYTRVLVKHLGEQSDMAVAVLTDKAAEFHESIPNVKVFPVVKGWGFSDIRIILDTCKIYAPDIVHIQFPTQGYGRKKLPWLLASIIDLMKIPVVQTWHEYYPLGGLMNIPNGFVRGGLIVVRPNYMERMPSWFQWLNRNKTIRFIPNASPIPLVSLTTDERNAIRSRYVGQSKNLVVYFGFAYPQKNIEALFDICDPCKHHVVLVCELNPSDDYHRFVLEKIQGEPWEKSVTVTGFLREEKVGEILSAADIVILPFRDGGGSWNTSLQAAILQGTFVLSTSREERGYDPSRNLYFVQPGNITEMRAALENHIGQKKERDVTTLPPDWHSISIHHVDLYRSIIARRSRN